MLISLVRILLTTIAALFVIGLCLAAWFLFTTEGNRELSLLIRDWEPRLSAQITGGELLNGIQAGSLGWEDENIAIRAEGIQSDWNALCLAAKLFCAEHVSIDRLNIHSRRKSTPSGGSDKTITLPDINLPLNLDLAELRIGELVVDYSDNANPVIVSNLRLQAESSGNQVNIRRLSARYKNIIASASGRITLENDYPLDLKLDWIAENLIDWRDLSVSSDLSGSLGDLSYSAQTFGVVRSRLQGTSRLLTPKMPTSARLSWHETGWPIESHTLARLTDGYIQIDGDLDDFRAQFQSGVSGEAIPPSEASVTGLINRNRLKAEEVAVNTLGGLIQGQAELDWSKQLAWNSSLHFADINPEQRFPQLPGNLAGNLLAQGTRDKQKNWTIKIKPAVVQGRLRGYPIHAHAIFSLDAEKQWEIESLRLINQQNKLTVSGKVSDTWDLKGNLALNRLKSLWPDLYGKLNGEFSVKGDLALPDMDIALKSSQLNWRDYSANNLHLRADIRQLAGQQSNLNFKADRITVHTRPIKNVQLQLGGTRLAHSGNLQASADPVKQLQMTVSGGLSEKLDWSGYLEKSRIALPHHPWTLRERTKLSWNPRSKIFTVDKHCWRNGRSRLCLKESLDASASGQAYWQLVDYPLQQLNRFLPDKTRLTGNSNADVSIGWGQEIAGKLHLNVSGQVNNGSVKVDVAKPEEGLNITYQRLTIDASVDKTAVTGNLALRSNDFGSADVNFNINPAERPMRFRTGFVELKGFDIAMLKGFLPDFDQFSGLVSAKGSFNGRLHEPVFSGTVVVKNPKLSSNDLPITVTGGSIKSIVTGRTASLSGQIESGNGQFSISGKADWKNIQAWQLVLNARGDALVFSEKPLIESVFAPDIELRIEPKNVEIRGNLNVLAAAINIKEIPERAIGPSPDVIISSEQESARDDPDGWNIKTDIQIKLGDAVRLSGYGMRAQLKGEFRLLKRDNKPFELHGEITIPQGTYKSYGQDLTVEDGQVLLIGPTNQSSLNIEAFREVEDVRAGLLITGSVDKPIITLYSEPPMEQERILAYIVLGRDINAGDSNDSNILATAALSMGIANGRGLATDIAEVFGIREFNIEASGRGEDTQVLLSGRLSSKLLIRYGVGVFTPVNTLYLRYELSRKLYLETAQGIERAVDLFYSMEF